MNLFVIYTPYQLLSGLNTVLEYGLTDCVFLMVHPNMKKYFRLYEEAMKIKFIDMSEIYDNKVYNGTKARFHIVIDMPRKQRVISKYRWLLERVSSMYVSSDDVIIRLIYKEIQKSKKAIEIYLIDDGTGTYMDYASKRLVSRMFFSLFLDGDFFSKVKRIYCYHPELLTESYRGMIPYTICMNSELVKKSYSLVEGNFDVYIGKKVIYLDQGKDEKNIGECLNLLLKYFSKDEILVKKHPRINANIDYSVFTVTQDGLPTELLFPYLNMDNCLLLSVNSTGCITPYLIENRKPTCVLLYNMMENDPSYYDKDRIFFECVNRKIGYEYVIAPKSVSEFEQYIRNLTEKLKGIEMKRGYMR